MAEKYITSTHQRHMQWLDYYNIITSECKKKNPTIFHAIDPKVFYQEVADHFNYNDVYVANILKGLIKNPKK